MAAPALGMVGGGTAPDPTKLLCPGSAAQAHAGPPRTAPVLIAAATVITTATASDAARDPARIWPRQRAHS